MEEVDDRVLSFGCKGGVREGSCYRIQTRMLATVAAYVLDVVSSYILVAPRVLGGSVSANKGIKFGLLKGSS